MAASAAGKGAGSAAAAAAAPGSGLPSFLRSLLEHVQEQALRAPSDRVKQRILRLFHCIAPRFTGRYTGAEALDIDLNVVRPLCADGVPDEVPALRAALWKVLLGYLPPDAFTWDEALKTADKSHGELVEDLIRELGARAEKAGTEEARKPLKATDSGSEELLEDVLDQIAKDVFRTRPELDLFARRLDGESVQSGREALGQLELAQPTHHYDVIGRVLLLYARVNPGVRYVQGMNELCAPLYFLFVQDPLRGHAAEVDTFFCFSLLMADMRDSFVKSLDDSENGMLGRIEQFSALLREKDEEVWLHLDKLQVQPIYFTLRWLTLMLTQELMMPDVLRLWDALLSDMARPHSLLLYICVAMVQEVRVGLLEGDFTACLGLLQRYPPISVDVLLQAARELRAADLVPEGFSNRDSAVADVHPLLQSAAAAAVARFGGLASWWQSRPEDADGPVGDPI
mmetsp:Transcript_2521/g.5062  ORF Transcript_2521/g.5062 Transcript_2521/m.5062 type:complete len:456 (+) Transcript_2521:66-1433(+)